MAGRTRKVKALRFRNFPTQWRGYAFFVEQGYNELLNLSIINHLEEIRKLLWKESSNFIYFPYLMHEIRDAAVYNFPQMTKGDFSQAATSDILLQLLDEKKVSRWLTKEQEAYVAESQNRALDQMEAHEKNDTKTMHSTTF